MVAFCGCACVCGVVCVNVNGGGAEIEESTVWIEISTSFI